MNTYLSQHDWEMLVAWCDGELDAEQRAQVARKVAEEQPWADALESLRLQNSAMDAWDVFDASAEASMVQKTIQAARAERTARRRFRVAASLAVAAAALIVAGVAMHILNQPETQIPSATTGGGSLAAPAPRTYGYIELDEMTRQQLLAELAAEDRPEWVEAAIDSFTAEQREELLAMPPSKRLERVVARHNALLKDKLTDSE